MTKRVCFICTLQRRFRQGNRPALLRGAGEDETEDGFRAAHRIFGQSEIRLRRILPVKADRVILTGAAAEYCISQRSRTDPKRSALKEAGEGKWYHGHEARLPVHIGNMRRKMGFFIYSTIYMI